MDENHDLFFLKHIIESCKQIEIYTKKYTYNKFSNDRLVQDAVIRQLEIIGEATKNIKNKRKVFRHSMC